jgi:hypothetical protein
MNCRILLLVGLVGVLASGCRTPAHLDNAEDDPEYSAAWTHSLSVEVEVESYSEEKDEILIFAFAFCAQGYAKNLSTVRILPPSAYAGEKYYVAVPDKVVGDFDPEPWKQVGSRIRLSLPEAFLKYRPHGFIPWTEFKREPNQSPQTTPVSAPR